MHKKAKNAVKKVVSEVTFKANDDLNNNLGTQAERYFQVRKNEGNKNRDLDNVKWIRNNQKVLVKDNGMKERQTTNFNKLLNEYSIRRLRNVKEHFVSRIYLLPQICGSRIEQSIGKNEHKKMLQGQMTFQKRLGNAQKKLDEFCMLLNKILKTEKNK